MIVGGAPGTGKSTLARALAGPLDAVVISTDDVRAEMAAAGEIAGAPGTLDAGLYRPENVAAVYGAVLRKAHLSLHQGRSVILDGTWGDAAQRDRARGMAAAAFCPVTELICAAPLSDTAERIESRSATTSQVTREIAAALGTGDWDRKHWPQAHRIDTTRAPETVLAEALGIFHPAH